MLLELHSGRLQAAFNLANGQLVSLQHKGIELMHGGGKPPELQSPSDAQGWQNSEIVMFPVVGPVKANRLLIDGKTYPVGQHGISRFLPWSVLEQRTDAIVFVQRYDAHAPVLNNKIDVPMLLPWSFTLEKRFSLLPQGLQVTLAVTNEGDAQLRYMIGWHPAFRMLDSRVGGRAMGEVQASRAVELSSSTVSFGPLRVTSDLPFMTLWSPKDSPLLCIEPMSRLQVWEGFERFTDDDFSLAPGERREHRVEIKLG